MTATDWVSLVAALFLATTAIGCAMFSTRQQQKPTQLEAAVDAAWNPDKTRWDGRKLVRPKKEKNT